MTAQERVALLTADVITNQMWVAKKASGSTDAQKSFLEGYWKPAVAQHPEIASLKTEFLLSMSLPIGGQP
jgi:hypothetical protein